MKNFRKTILKDIAILASLAAVLASVLIFGVFAIKLINIEAIRVTLYVVIFGAAWLVFLFFAIVPLLRDAVNASIEKKAVMNEKEKSDDKKKKEKRNKIAATVMKTVSITILLLSVIYSVIYFSTAEISESYIVHAFKLIGLVIISLLLGDSLPELLSETFAGAGLLVVLLGISFLTVYIINHFIKIKNEAEKHKFRE